MMGWLRDLWDGFKSLISEIFGGSSSSGNSVDSKAEIHKRFVRFSKQLSGDAKKQEDESMAEVRGAFEGIIKKYRKDYPDVLSAIMDKQEKAENSIKGSIVGYVEKNATENNEDN